jgi:hypothetical protein
MEVREMAPEDEVDFKKGAPVTETPEAKTPNEGFDCPVMRYS